MIFVNEIAEIVHEVVNSHGGAPNKNIGEAFLLIWRFKEEDTERGENNSIALKIQNPNVVAITELAIVAFMKVHSEIALSPQLDKVVKFLR